MPKKTAFTPADFEKVVGFRFISQSQKQFDAWNTFVRMSPAEFHAAICEGPLADIPLVVEMAYQGSFISVKLGKRIPNDTSFLGYAPENAFQMSAQFELKNGNGEFEYIKIPEPMQEQGLGTLATVRTFSLARRLGVSRIRAEMHLAAGGYAWARLGFMPNAPDWDDLRKEYILPRLAAFGKGIPEGARAQIETAAASDDPENIFLIAALKTPCREIPLGRWLMAHGYWNPDTDPNPNFIYECWKAMRETAMGRLEKLKDNIPQKIFEKVSTLLQKASSEELKEIIHIPETVDGIPAGQLMLVGTRWYGELDFDNPVQAAIFDAVAKRIAPAPLPPALRRPKGPS